jgi:5'-methylthioadenosine/S-adenosylhomocysteine nucleosidase
MSRILSALFCALFVFSIHSIDARAANDASTGKGTSKSSRILFLTAMQQELEPLLKSHLVKKDRQLYPDLTIYEGKLDHHQLSVGLLGIGKVNAAYATTQYILATKPDVVILFGSAGGLHALKRGVLFAAAQTWTYDYGAVNASGFEHWASGSLPIGENQPPVKRVIDSNIRTAVSSKHPKVEWVTVASGDTFINNTEISQRLAKQGADLVDMESAVVEDLAARFKIPSLVLRVVSDAANDDAHTDFSGSLDQVSENATPEVISIIRTVADAVPAAKE